MTRSTILCLMISLSLGSHELLSQDKGFYSVSGVEVSALPVNILEGTIAFTQVNSKEKSNLSVTPSIYYGVGYCFDKFLVEFSLLGSYTRKSRELSLIEYYTPLGYLAEERSRSLVIDQLNLEPRITVSGEIIKNLSIRTSFKAPIKIIDNTHIEYVNSTYWSNFSIGSGSDDYTILAEPEIFEGQIEERSIWGTKFHVLASLGLEWRMFNWDFGYITFERPRTLSFYAVYTTHLTDNNIIIPGTRIGNFFTSGLKVSF